MCDCLREVGVERLDEVITNMFDPITTDNLSYVACVHSSLVGSAHLPLNTLNDVIEACMTSPLE